MSDLLQAAKLRIERIRKTDVEALVTRHGLPVPGAKVAFRQQSHHFLFGAVCYAHGKLGDAAAERRFTELFTSLLNYTMMPFHWSWYEPRRGEYAEPYTGNLVDWADENRLKKKLHALIWHECCPDWLRPGDDIKALYARRIDDIMRRYGGRFDFIDLANETTVNDRFDNPVSRWVKEFGPVNVIKFASALVRARQPDAKLIYGDWNVHGEDYFDFLRRLREEGADIDLLGLQSHMHRDLWTPEETLRVMDRASAFGWPLHFPECSICSGKPVGDMSYAPGAVNRFTESPEDALWQAEFARDFYTLVYSHPAVEALSWFDFTDHRWLGAPAGLADDSLNPKPVYYALRDLIHNQWKTDVDAATGENGVAGAHLTFGDYIVTVQTESGRAAFPLSLPRPSFYEGGGRRRVTLALYT